MFSRALPSLISMYVCICKAVSESRIRRAVGEGACTLRDLTRELGLGTCCGKCVPAAREVLSSALPEVSAPLMQAAARTRSV